MRTIERNRPPVESEVPRHFKKRRQVAHPYGIEGRYVGEKQRGFLGEWLEECRNWHLRGTYAKSRDRDNAIARMRTSDRFGCRGFEFREVNP